MIILRFFPALVLSAFLWAHSACADEDGEGPYPVWWEPVIEYAAEFGFKFERLEDAEDLLTTPSPHGRMWVARKDEPEENGYEINDCATLKRLAESNDHKVYVGQPNWSAWESYYATSWGTFCRTLDILSKAIPAKKSFIRDFSFDEDALDYLPAFVGVAIACEQACRYFFANEERIPFRQTPHDYYESIVAIDEKQIEMTYTELGRRLGTEIKLLARGDFNHDGLEDLLIRSNVTLPSSSISELFVASRDAPDAVLYVIYPEQHICSAETYLKCDPEIHDISEWRDLK